MKRLLLAVAAALWLTGNLQAQTAEIQDGLDRLLQTLKESKAESSTRLDAVVRLADYGPKAAAAVPHLIEALGTKDEDLRLNAAIALGKIGKAAVAPLAKLLEGDDADQRFYALWTLAWIGTDAKSTASKVLALLSDKNDEVRRKAAYALGRIGADADTSIPALIKVFGDEQESVREAAGKAVAQFGVKAVPALVAALKERSTREQAASSLGEVGAEARAAIPALQKALLEAENDKAEPTKGETKPGLQPAPPIRFPGRRPFPMPGPFPGLGDGPTTGNVFADALAAIGKEAVPALNDIVKKGNEASRFAAIQALAKIGADAVPALVDLLGDKRTDVRRLASQSLVPLRVGDKMVVTAFAYYLKRDADEQVRLNCLQGLQMLGPVAKLAAPALQEALVDINHNIRQQAFYALNNMGVDPRPGLRKGLDSKDAPIRINTASLMMSVGLDRNLAQPILVEGLKEKDDGLRMQAAHALAMARLESTKVVPTLIEGLKHSSMGVRQQAIQALQMMGPNARESAPALLDLVENDKEGNLRQQAIYTLRNVQGDPAAVVPVLDRILRKDEDVGVRQAVVQVLNQYGAQAVPILIAATRDKNPSIRQQAIYSLQNVRGDLSDSLKDLEPLFKDKDLNVRMAVFPLLVRMGDKGMPYLLDGLKDKNDQVRWTAAAHLRNMGQRGVKAVPILTDLLQDKNGNVRSHAAQALANMGNEGVEVLLKACKAKDASEEIRNITMQSLMYGPHRQKVLPLIFDILENDKGPGRLQALYAIQNMGRLKTAPPKLVPTLMECLKDTNPQIRWMAAMNLGNLGASAADALPVLRSLAKDTHPTVRAQAANAVTRIEREKKR